MVGGTAAQPGPGTPAEEVACLRALTQGQDAWQGFFVIFGRFIYAELFRRGISNHDDQDDLMQDLALKLCANDCAIIKRFLLRDSGYSFRAVLRAVIRSIVIDEWRKKAKWRNVVLCEDEPTLEQLCAYRADGNLMRELYHGAWLSSMLLRACGPGNQLGFSIMSLRYLDGYSVDQIGKRLGMKPNAVSQRIRYYLGKLRELGWVEVLDA